MKRPYREAIRWIVDNDDTEWLDEEDAAPNVTAVFLADIFDVDHDKVIADLRRGLRDRTR
jgi:hypothetical protein